MIIRKGAAGSFSILFFALLIGWVGKAEAVPSFSRQVGLPCNACHYQYFPKLNAFGRDFKAGGFTQTSQELISDDGISLPMVLNASFFVSIQYYKADLKTPNNPKSGAERGEWAVPEEASLYLAGRVGEHVGGLLEIAGKAPDYGVENLRLVYSTDISGMQGGVSFYNTGSMGPAYGMELWNAGAQMHILPGINTMASSATLASMLGGGTASGATAFLKGGHFFAAFGLWSPIRYVGDTGFDLSSYYRLALTGDVAGFDSMIGIVGTAGKTKAVESELNVGQAGTEQTQKTAAMAFNAQSQGDIGGHPLGLYLEYVPDMGKDYSATEESKYSSAMRYNYSAYSLQADLNITPVFGVRAAYLANSFKNTMGGMESSLNNNATTLGFWYIMAQNMQFHVDYTSYGGDKSDMVTSPINNKNSDLFVVFKAGF